MSPWPIRGAVLVGLALATCAGAAETSANDARANGDETAPAQATENTLSLDVHSVVNSGHVGAVHDLQYDVARNLLFSAGDDGTVRVWDARNGALYRSLRVTRQAAQMIAVDPSASRLAVVASDGILSFSLSVWDWEQEKQVLRIPLKDAPLFLRYSGQGNFLVYGVSSWQSLVILDANTGVPMQFHPEGFGIVGFAEISRSEKTIMTYQVSGRISYWDMTSGDPVRDVPTIRYLSHIRISLDRRFIVGSTGSEAVLVDTLSGAVKGRAAATGEMSLDISPAGDQVAGVSTAGGGPVAWNVGPDSFLPDPVRMDQQDSGDSFQFVCYGASGLYVASRSGAISELSASGDLRPVGQNVLADITGIDARNGLLAAGSRDWIRIFRSDLLEASHVPSFVHSLLIENPWKSAVGLAFLSDTSLLVWSRDANAPRFALLDLADRDLPRSGSTASARPVMVRTLPSGFRAPLVDLAPFGDYLIGTETGGTVRVVDLATGFIRFETRVPALSAVVAGASSQLIGGKNTALAAGGSLLLINTRTGETVGIPGRNVFTWDLVYDPSGPSPGKPVLYSLGVDARGATNLLFHEGASFEKETVIASDPEEVLDASLALDPATHVLFASLGRAGIVSWNGVRATTLPSDYATWRRLLAHDGLIMTLDKDSTIVIMDETSGARIAEVSLFIDGEWAVLVRGGGYFASPGGDAHVKVYVNDSAVKATEDYRLRIESW